LSIYKKYFDWKYKRSWLVRKRHRMVYYCQGSPSRPLCLQMAEYRNINDVPEEVADRTGLKRHLLRFRHRGRYVRRDLLALLHSHHICNQINHAFLDGDIPSKIVMCDTKSCYMHFLLWDIHFVLVQMLTTCGVWLISLKLQRKCRNAMFIFFYMC
jgi:hypothetical protein